MTETQSPITDGRRAQFPLADPSLPIYSLFVAHSDAALVVQSPDYILTKRQEELAGRTGLSTGGLGPWTFLDALEATARHLKTKDFFLIRLDPATPGENPLVRAPVAGDVCFCRHCKKSSRCVAKIDLPRATWCGNCERNSGLTVMATRRVVDHHRPTSAT